MRMHICMMTFTLVGDICGGDMLNGGGDGVVVCGGCDEMLSAPC